MHALVTGACGFVGRNLCAHLRVQGWTVTRCVREPTTDADAVHLPELDAASIAALPFDCDAVFHLAGLAHCYPPNVPSDAEYERINGTAVGLVATAARDRARALVFVSSVAAVTSGGDQPIGPDTPPNPQTAYGRSKLLGETLARAALEGSATSLRIVRFPAVYGAGAPGALGQLARWTARDRPVPSCAAQVRRSMIAIGNAVSVLGLAATHRALDGRCIMPSDGPAPDVVTVARLIAQAQGRTLRVWPVPRAMLGLAGVAARLAPGGGIPGLASIDRLLASCIIEDPQLAERTRWVPPVTMQDAIARTFARTFAPGEVRA